MKNAVIHAVVITPGGRSATIIVSHHDQFWVGHAQRREQERQLLEAQSYEVKAASHAQG